MTAMLRVLLCILLHVYLIADYNWSVVEFKQTDLVFAHQSIATAIFYKKKFLN